MFVELWAMSEERWNKTEVKAMLVFLVVVLEVIATVCLWVYTDHTYATALGLWFILANSSGLQVLKSNCCCKGE